MRSTFTFYPQSLIVYRLMDSALKRPNVFMGESMEYLGHRIDAQGLHPTGDKLAAIRDAPQHENVSELRSFLGLLNYYDKFIPNLATITHPLNHLLQKNVPFQ